MPALDASTEFQDKINDALNAAGLADQHQKLNTDDTEAGPKILSCRVNS